MYKDPITKRVELIMLLYAQRELITFRNQPVVPAKQPTKIEAKPQPK